MKFPIPLLAAMLLIFSAGASFGQTLNWHNAVFDNLADSNGDPLDGQFTFQLGTFVDPFDPGLSEPENWLSNWVVFDEAEFNPLTEYFTGVSLMNPDGTSDSAQMTPGALSFEGKQAYIWIRNDDVADYPSEWMLVSDESWVFPDAEEGCCPNRNILEWAISDLDGSDTPLFGGQSGVEGPGEYTETSDDYVLQTYTFVPEPSTLAVLVISAGLGLLRRRRS